MGGGYSGPSETQLMAQREHEAAMMAMQRSMYDQQTRQQEAFLKEQMQAAERQRSSNELASKDAAAAAQSSAAQLAARQNQQQIAQQLEGKDVMQRLADQSAGKTYQQALTGGAENVTGGYNPNTARANVMTTLGLAAAGLPQTQSNLINSIYPVNPAATTAGQQSKYTNRTNF